MARTGSVENAIVFGIFAVIVAILGIAVWGAGGGDGMLGPTDGGGLGDTASAREAPAPSVIPPDVGSALDEAQARRDLIARRQREGVEGLLGGGHGSAGGTGRPAEPTASPAGAAEGAMGAAPGAAPTGGNLRGDLAAGRETADPRTDGTDPERSGGGMMHLRNDVRVDGRGAPGAASAGTPAPTGTEATKTGAGVGPAAAQPAFREYLVKDGDTLWKIARQAYGDGDAARMVDLILEANPTVSPDRIYAGTTKLKLPTVLPEGVVTKPIRPQTEAPATAPTRDDARTDGDARVEPGTPRQEPTGEWRFYEVQEGDTLDRIAKEQIGPDATFNDIWVLNRKHLESPEKIYPGQTLRLPAKP